MILRHETCTVQGDNVFKYRCAVTRGFRLMNIQSIRGKVLTATARGVGDLKPVLSLSSHDL